MSRTSKTEKERKVSQELEAKLNRLPDMLTETASKQLFTTVNDVVVTEDDIVRFKNNKWSDWSEDELARLIAVLQDYQTSNGGAGRYLLLTNILYRELPVAIKNGEIKAFPTQITTEFIEYACKEYDWFARQWQVCREMEAFGITEKAMLKELNEGVTKLFLCVEHGWNDSKKLIVEDHKEENGFINIDPFQEV